MAGIKMTHVPNRGATEAVTAIIVGQRADRHHRRCRRWCRSFRTSVSAARRSRPASACRSCRMRRASAETVKGYDFTAWCALLAPAKTPPEIVQKLNAAARAALADPAVSKRLFDLGFVNTPGSPGGACHDPEGGIRPHRKTDPRRGHHQLEPSRNHLRKSQHENRHPR